MNRLVGLWAWVCEPHLARKARQDCDWIDGLKDVRGLQLYRAPHATSANATLGWHLPGVGLVAGAFLRRQNPFDDGTATMLRSPAWFVNSAIKATRLVSIGFFALKFALRLPCKLQRRAIHNQQRN